ncbi:MAG TPA: hypothetical protein H9909_05835 [Candidatus Mediterraneibacter norfolkensis]|nr:hypothetical protein [Candidatus Mediterraneibacter norfolkensis]
MAAVRRTRSYRRAGMSSGDRRQLYVYGSTVRQAEVRPERRPQEQPAVPRHASRQVMKNRNRAMSISPAYAVFLVAAAICAVFLCVMYLRLQADVVNRSENITALQEQLADLTEANDTAYNAAADSLNLEEVKDKAMNEMGMVYESQGTVIEYDSPSGSYVKQYDNIPEDGVLAKSRNVSE